MCSRSKKSVCAISEKVTNVFFINLLHDWKTMWKSLHVSRALVHASLGFTPSPFIKLWSVEGNTCHFEVSAAVSKIYTSVGNKIGSHYTFLFWEQSDITLTISENINHRVREQESSCPQHLLRNFLYLQRDFCPCKKCTSNSTNISSYMLLINGAELVLVRYEATLTIELSLKSSAPM